MRTGALALVVVVVVVVGSAGCPDFGALRLPDAGERAPGDGGSADGGEGEGEGEDAGTPTCPADPFDAGPRPLAQNWACVLNCTGGSGRVYNALALDPTTGEIVGASSSGALDTIRVTDAGGLVVTETMACPGSPGLDGSRPLTSVVVAKDGTRVAGGAEVLCVALPGAAPRTAQLFDAPNDDQVTPAFVDDGEHFTAAHYVFPEAAGPQGRIGLYTSAEALAIAADAGPSQPGEAFVPSFPVEFEMSPLPDRRDVRVFALARRDGGYVTATLEGDGTTTTAAADDLFTTPLVAAGPTLGDGDDVGGVLATSYALADGTLGIAAIALGSTLTHLHVGALDGATGTLSLPVVAGPLVTRVDPFLETMRGVAVSGSGSAALFGEGGFLAVAATPAGPYAPLPYGERASIIDRLVVDRAAHALWALGQGGAIAYFADHDMPGPVSPELGAARCGDDYPTARARFANAYSITAATVLADGRLVAAGDDGVFIAHPPDAGARTMTTRSASNVLQLDPPSPPVAIGAGPDPAGTALYAVLADGTIAKAILAGDVVGAFQRVPELQTAFAAGAFAVRAAVDEETPDGPSFWVYGENSSGPGLQHCDPQLGACDGEVFPVQLAFAADDVITAVAVLHDGVAGAGTAGVFYAEFVVARAGVSLPLVVTPLDADQETALKETTSIVATRPGCLLLDGYFGVLDVDMAAAGGVIDRAHVGDPATEILSLVANPFGGFVGSSRGGVLQYMATLPGCAFEDAVTQPVALGPARGVHTFGAAIWVGESLYVADDHAMVWRVPFTAP